MLVEELSHERGAAAGGGEDEDVRLPGGEVVGESGALITQPFGRVSILAQAAVDGDGAAVEGFGGEGADCRVLDRNGCQG